MIRALQYATATAIQQEDMLLYRKHARRLAIQNILGPEIKTLKMILESRAQSLKPINTHLGILETQLFAHNSTNLTVSGAVIFVYYFYFLFYFLFFISCFLQG